jgi:transposase
MFEAIRWVLTTGAQWDEIPIKYESGKTAWQRFTSWKKQGVWKRIWQQLLIMLDKQDKITWNVSYLDGTFASAKKGGQKMERRNEAKAPR